MQTFTVARAAGSARLPQGQLQMATVAARVERARGEFQVVLEDIPNCLTDVHVGPSYGTGRPNLHCSRPFARRMFDQFASDAGEILLNLATGISQMRPNMPLATGGHPFNCTAGSNCRSATADLFMKRGIMGKHNPRRNDGFVDSMRLACIECESALRIPRRPSTYNPFGVLRQEGSNYAFADAFDQDFAGVYRDANQVRFAQWQGIVLDLVRRPGGGIQSRLKRGFGI